MITEEKWNRAFELTMPVISTGIGVLSAALAAMALMRSSPLGQRVFYQDGQYLVNVRYGQWHDLRGFVQPSNPDVLAIFSQYGPDYWSLYDFVCRHVAYKSEVREHWQFPSETLARGEGDCEDTSILLTSLLRCVGIDAYTAIGEYLGYGHAWTTQNGFIYETTYTRARPIADPQDYYPYCIFNESEVSELWPGALGEVFRLSRDEATKLNLIAQAL
ncbi:unnamed protein product, partial [marine sediment metagenome]